jgi:hypothetical protein
VPPHHPPDSQRVLREGSKCATPGLREAWESGDTGRFLVEGAAIRYTEGSDVGVKR